MKSQISKLTLVPLLAVVLGFLSLSLATPLAFAAAGDAPAVPAQSAPAAAAPAAGEAAPAQPQSAPSMLPLMIAMMAIVYFISFRPKQKEMKKQMEMLNSLKHGDEIVTASGILGKVTGIADKVVTVEIADDVRVKMLKSQVNQVIKGNLKDNLKDAAQ